ncbi:MAG: precorrin-8X methylmutase [Actinomycetota bacterium]|nr:precorrin-8X methylmutase [Actinomycetota bacterium]
MTDPPPPGAPAAPHPIEAESYRLLRAAIDLSHLPPLARAVTERVIHATADLAYAADLVLDEAALQQGLAALRAGCLVVADVAMVATGIASRRVCCRLNDPAVGGVAAERGLTRSAAGMLLAAAAAGPGSVHVVGCAPTALRALLDVDVEPALVIGLPVGFVDAAESKQALRSSGLPSLTNRSAKGGSAAAAAAVNALLQALEPA